MVERPCERRERPEDRSFSASPEERLTMARSWTTALEIPQLPPRHALQIGAPQVIWLERWALCQSSRCRLVAWPPSGAARVGYLRAVLSPISRNRPLAGSRGDCGCPPASGGSPPLALPGAAVVPFPRRRSVCQSCGDSKAAWLNGFGAPELSREHWSRMRKEQSKIAPCNAEAGLPPSMRKMRGHEAAQSRGIFGRGFAAFVFRTTPKDE